MTPTQPATVGLNGQGKKSPEEILLGLALRYAQRGWAVFPVHIPVRGECSCGRPACPNKGKHPRTAHGFYDATTDPEQIRVWWGFEHPVSNIGIRTGPESGLVVLDEDPRHGGDASLRQLEAQYGPLPATPTVVSGGGGRHLYFQHPGFSVRSGSDVLGAGLDIKGDKGSIVAPPSLHASGGRYQWERGKNPDTVPLAPLPAWLSDLLKGPHGEEEKHNPKGRTSLAAQIIPDGERNNELFRLGRKLWQEGVTQETLLTALLSENDGRCVPPLPEAEVKQIARSMARYDAPATPLLDLGADDEGNALAVKMLFGEHFLYCPAYGWLHFNGRYWQHEGAVPQLERTTIEALKMRQAQAVQANRQDIVLAAKPSASHMQSAITLLRSQVQADVQEFDASPDHLNVANGVVDLRTGTLELHHPGQRFTYCLAVEYDASADCSLWLDFLRQVVTEDTPEVITFLQEAMGYALTGHTKEEKLLYLYGPTRSGKGTFTETLLALLGHPLSTEVDFNTFTRDRSTDANNFDLAPLKPARLLVASESSRYEKLNEAKIKQLTGGNYIRCAFKYGTHFTYRLQSKIVLVSNHEIKADPIDSALWGRIVRVEFPYSYLGREDTTLKERLKYPEHLQGALAWAVRGAIRWYQKGLRVPTVLQEHLKEIRLEQDHIQQWLDACTVRDATSFVSNATLAESYELWCAGEGYNPSNMVHLGRALK